MDIIAIRKEHIKKMEYLKSTLSLLETRQIRMTHLPEHIERTQQRIKDYKEGRLATFLPRDKDVSKYENELRESKIPHEKTMSNVEKLRNLASEVQRIMEK